MLSLKQKLRKTCVILGVLAFICCMDTFACGQTDTDAADADKKAAVKDALVMNFTDAPVMAVLNEMSEQLSLVIINPPDISARVTIISKQPLTTAEAVDSLNAVLADNGYTAIISGKTLRIVSLEAAKQASVPVRSGSDPAKIATGESMITQIIPLKYAEAGKLKEDIEGLVPEYAHVTSNEDSNTLILTARQSDVRHIVEIVSELDIQLSGVNSVQVFQLEFADAESVSDLINDIFGEETSSSSRNEDPRARFMRRMMGGGGDNNNNDAGSNARVQMQKVNSSFDEQTNSVVVSAPAEILSVIASVVEELDGNPTAEESIFVYALSNAKAENLEEILQDIFDEDSGSLSNNNNNRSAFRGRGGPFGALAQSSSSSSSGLGDLAGKVYVVADTDTNSLMVRTAPKYFDRVKMLLKELDRPTRQVLIKVLIAEVTHDNSLDLGAEFSVLNLNIDTGSASVGTDFGVAQLGSGLVGKFTSTDFSATLGALQQLGKLEVLSRPYLLCSENQEASIVVGEEVPYITNRREDGDGDPVSSVDYRDIGIILNVTPYIGPDGMVIMDVDQEISSTTGRTVKVSEDFEAEVYATRSAQTKVSVASGATIVIGGLMQDNVVETVNQIPLLGSIPVLGHLFKRTENTHQKTELLLFLSPQVALDQNEVKEISESAVKDGSELSRSRKDGKFTETLEQFSGQSGGQLQSDDKLESENKADPENEKE